MSNPKRKILATMSALALAAPISLFGCDDREDAYDTGEYGEVEDYEGASGAGIDDRHVNRA